MAASTLRESDTYLGAQFRRFRSRLGPPVATKAVAAKLARLVYRMLRYGLKYVDQGAERYETQYRKQQVSYLKRRAAQLGLQIMEATVPA
jgi:transposase